jgi:hypothetical protein
VSMKRNMFGFLALCLVLVLQGSTGGGGGEKNKPPKIDSFSPAEKTLTVVPEEEVDFRVSLQIPMATFYPIPGLNLGMVRLQPGTAALRP